MMDLSPKKLNFTYNHNVIAKIGSQERYKHYQDKNLKTQYGGSYQILPDYGHLLNKQRNSVIVQKLTNSHTDLKSKLKQQNFDVYHQSKPDKNPDYQTIKK